MIAVITPWKGLLHLLPAYARVTEGCAPIIVDTSDRTSADLMALCEERRGVYLRDTTQPFSYARVCNAGLRGAAYLGASVAICLNNDVEGEPGALQAAATIADGALYGPELRTLRTLGQPHAYVNGWCVAATMATWKELQWSEDDPPSWPAVENTIDLVYRTCGPWDDENYEGSYHEDVDLSWRAARAGIYLRQTAWPIRHLGEQTAKQTPGANEHHAHNRQVFEQRVRTWREAQQ